MGKDRKLRLEESRAFYQFAQDHDEEEAWITEKQRICKAAINTKDLSSVLSMQQKHKVTIYDIFRHFKNKFSYLNNKSNFLMKALEDEVSARQNNSETIIKVSEDLVSAKHPDSKEVKMRLLSLHRKWEELHELMKHKQKQLSEVGEAYQVSMAFVEEDEASLEALTFKWSSLSLNDSNVILITL